MTTATGRRVGGGLRGRTLRLLGAFSLVGALGALGAGVAFGYFSATATATDAGDADVGHLAVTAVLSSTASVSHTCTISAMTPGESSTGWTSGSRTDTPCAFTVALTASGPAFLGLGLATTGGLYVAGTPQSLRFEVTDTAGTSYTANGTVTASTGTHPLYVGTSSSSGPHSFTVDFSLPETAPARLENQTTTLTLTVYTVTTGVGSASGCSPGAQCPGITRWT
jgi:hypothetical protein